MKAVYNQALCPTSCSHRTPEHKQTLNINANGTVTVALKGNVMSRTGSVTGKGRNFISVASVKELTHDSETKARQNIPTEKQSVDPFRQGNITDGGVRYKQTVVIRSYEVGADKTATLESILNLLQETALNHVWVSGLLGDGFGATHGMVRNNLIWVVTRMQVQVDEYPIWGEVMEVDTWVGASGKNGMRRDWLIRSDATGEVLVRATSTWVMMNQQTRRLSKMPVVVREEISPWFIEKKAFEEEIPEKINKLNKTAKFTNSNLKPKRSDLDMNQHVNNVKYVNWTLETIPHKFLKNYQLTRITLEYRRECRSSDVVQSLCEPEEESYEERHHESSNVDKANSLASALFQDCNHNKSLQTYTHLLQITGDKEESEEIVRGRTMWKRKL
ncbi:unnamed protein product [Dovyalis caffra]|uniref:Acyl-[acyl-carrier-protein] hydrolase n=1 Tax=Dovyalis caffra TaxID=77055 RepID=A0AAV1SIH2_9ROSI|nr:unnamed protein product [Dovyalis caffra]